MILFHSLYIYPKQNYLHSIHFYSFILKHPIKFTYFHSIPYRSIIFHSFPLLKYISFHSISLNSLMIIPFYSIPLRFKEDAFNILFPLQPIFNEFHTQNKTIHKWLIHSSIILASK